MTRSLALVLALLLTPAVNVGLVAGQQGVAVAPAPGPTPQSGAGPAVPPGVPGFPAGLPARDQGRRTGTARIRGRITAADSGQPLRRATVRVSAPEIREMVSTTTGPDGLYEVKDLPAGRYTVTASKAAYATLSYGQTRAADGGRPIELKDSEVIERIDLRLPRGGVITGVIVDEFGEPVPDASVSALRQQFINGQRRLVAVSSPASSNDIGAYRLFGLTPGTYYLSVTSRSFMMTLDNRSDDRTGYAPTYYPGTPEVASAQRLTVAAGQTLADINVSLIPTQTAVVSGVVLDASGQRIRAGGVMAMPRRSSLAPFGLFGSVGGAIRPDGTFTISGVAPGEYTIRAMLPPDSSGPGGAAMAHVTVAGQDVTGVQLIPSVPSTVIGRITLDGGAVQSFGGTPVQLMLAPANFDDVGVGMAMPGPLTPRDDLSFDTKVLPGRTLVRLMGAGGRWSLKAVRHQGVDVTDTGIDVPAGQNVADIEVDLTSQRQEVSGLVTAAGGKPTANYTAVVFAQDRERWTSNSRYVGVGRPDQEGRFRVRNLPPGDYYAVAVEYIEPGAWMDPDFLDSVRHAGTSVSLNEGEARTVDLRLADPR